MVESKVETAQPYTPGPNAIDITPEKNGGVLKEIKKEGLGDAHPLKGDKVSVHYVGTLLDGSKFDSSRDRGDLFEFNLGQGSVIKAWDIGVATMKKGEVSVLVCKPDYAYGKTGSPPKIPPESTLVFEVELFSWKGEDVTDESDEGVLKSILEQGEGYQTPSDGATCDVHLVGKLDGKVFETRNVTFVIGEATESGLVEGVELAVKKMKKGEKAFLKIGAKYGYGAKGNENLSIPPSSDLEYEVHLIKFEKCKESWEMDAKEKIEQSEIFKNKGTDFFKAGKFKIALKYYSKIVDFLKSEEMQTEEAEAESQKVKCNELLLAAFLNKSLCHLKLKEDLEALHSCDEALKLQPNNEKAFFRRATAHQNLQNFDEAIYDFKKVLEVDPENKAAKNQLALTLQKMKQLKEKEKKTYAGMFTKFAAADSKKEKDQKEETKTEGKGSEDKEKGEKVDEVSESSPMEVNA